MGDLAASAAPGRVALPSTPALPLTAPPAVAFDEPNARQAPPSAAFASAWADAHDKLAAGRYAEALAVL